MTKVEGRRSLVRVVVYLVALAVVVILFRQRHVFTPSYDLQVVQVREADQLGSLAAQKGQKLVVVEVRLTASSGISGRLKPSHFALRDSQGREHRPDPLSPLLSQTFPGGQVQEIEGTLVFRLPREVVSESLSFHAEVEEDAGDHQSEDIGPKGGS